MRYILELSPNNEPKSNSLNNQNKNNFIIAFIIYNDFIKCLQSILFKSLDKAYLKLE